MAIDCNANGSFEAFRAIEIPEDKALKAAAALSKRDDDVASLKTDTAILKWMMGLCLPFRWRVSPSCSCTGGIDEIIGPGLGVCSLSGRAGTAT